MSDENQVATTDTEQENTVQTKDGVQIIPADNPTKEELSEIDSKVKEQMKVETVPTPTEFTFRKQKDDSGIETKRAPLTVPLPIPTINGVLAIIEGGGKGLELLREAVTNIINAQARDLITQDESLNASNFPYEQLDWDFIANMPKATRKGGGIPKEIWEGFGKDYIEVMPDATSKSVEQVTTAAKLFTAKLQPVKTNKKVLAVLQDQLGIYAEATPNLEDYAECVEFLVGKISDLMETSENALLDAL